MLILENAGSSDLGVYSQILSASVGDSSANLDFQFSIEVIGEGEKNDTASSSDAGS